MNKRITCFISIIFFLCITSLQAQKIGIGEWRDHLSYSQTQGVAVVGQEVYVMSPYGLFIYDQSDNIIERFSKINGLTENGFTNIKYDRQQNCLMILYANSDIDVIKNNVIYNLPDIKLSSIIGDKNLYNVYFENQLSYICCGFGIVVVDADKLEVVETYRLGTNQEVLSVYDMTADDTCFYAATNHGIYKARKDNALLPFYKSWQKLPNLPATDGTYSYIEFYGNQLVYALSTVVTDYVYQQPMNCSQPIQLYQGDCYNVDVTEGPLAVATGSGLYMYQNQSFDNPTVITHYNNDVIKAHQVAVANGVYWIADENMGLLKGSSLSNIQIIGMPNGPYSYNCFDLKAHNNQVWVSAGYYDEDSWYYGNSKEGASTFDGVSWTSFHPTAGNVPLNTHDMCVALVNPTNTSQSFVGTWGRGLYQFDNNEFTTAYNEGNSTLQPRSVAPDQGVFVSGLAFDSKGNLWIANSSCNNLLSCKSVDGTWKSYNLTVASNEDIRELYIDENDQKWIISRHNDALFVFKESSDGNHLARKISVAGSEGSNSKVISLAFDKKGTLWLGTDDGIVLLENPEEVLEKSGNGFSELELSYPKIEWDGYTRLLLSGEIVSSIVVNGNNDKWISTKYSGLYKVAEYGTEELDHFTVDNSPLFSNNILDMCQTANGELFIGTAYGIISYRDIATEPKEDNSEVYVFPNPVKPEYNGYIAITNLADKSYIKITDISGTLVYNCQASGGQAVWDGKNLNGQRVKTGVYLVFIANEDGSQKEVTKIMFLN